MRHFMKTSTTIVLFLFTLTLVCCTSESKPKESTPTESRIQGLKDLCHNELIDGSNFPEFKKTCELAHKFDPTDSDINFLLGHVSFFEKDFPKAIDYVNSCMKSSGDKNSDYDAFKGCIFHELSNSDSSIFYFQRMLSKNNTDTSWFFLELITACENFGFSKKAVEYIDVALKLYPNDVNIISLKSVDETNKGNYEYALELYNKVEFRNLTNPEYYYYRTICYMKLKKFENALLNAEKTYSIDSLTPKYVTARGRMRHRTMDFVGAKRDYLKAINLGDTTATRFYAQLKSEHPLD